MSLQDLGIQNLWLFVLAVWVLVLTPGPDVFYVRASSLRGGWRGGLAAVAGICSGCLGHVLAATLGVGALIAASSTAFTVLKWLGAAYLVYIGFKMLTSRGDAAPRLETCESRQSLKTVFICGFWSNFLNPKVALFFLAFLPQFIAPSAAQPTLGFLALGVLLIVNSLPILFGFVALARWASMRLRRLQFGLSALERVAGALFVGFGVRLAFSDR